MSPAPDHDLHLRTAAPVVAPNRFLLSSQIRDRARSCLRLTRTLWDLLTTYLLWAALCAVTPRPNIQPGQAWRRRVDGLLVRVTDVQWVSKYDLQVSWVDALQADRCGMVSASSFGWLTGYDLEDRKTATGTKDAS